MGPSARNAAARSRRRAFVDTSRTWVLPLHHDRRQSRVPRVHPDATRYSLTRGWPLVAIAGSALVLMVLALLAGFGTDELGIRVVIRATARTSFFSSCWRSSRLR